MYMTDHIFTILPIKNLVHNDGGPTTPQNMATDTKTSVSKNTCSILSMCFNFNKINKHGSSFTKGFSWHLLWNPTK